MHRADPTVLPAEHVGVVRSVTERRARAEHVRRLDLPPAGVVVLALEHLSDALHRDVLHPADAGERDVLVADEPTGQLGVTPVERLELTLTAERRVELARTGTTHHAHVTAVPLGQLLLDVRERRDAPELLLARDHDQVVLHVHLSEVDAVLVELDLHTGGPVLARLDHDLLRDHRHLRLLTGARQADGRDGATVRVEELELLAERALAEVDVGGLQVLHLRVFQDSPPGLSWDYLATTVLPTFSSQGYILSKNFLA